MASSTLDPLIPPPQAHQAQHQNYVVLPLYFNQSWWTSPSSRKNLYVSSLLILAVASVAGIYAFWPSDPDLKIQRLRLLHFKVHVRPHIAVDISLAATVLVLNRDVYSMDYTALDVAVGYRGKWLGHVMSGGGHVRSRGSSYVDATLDFHGVVISDWIGLVDDLAKGLIRFDTVTRVDGLLGLFFFEVPLKTKLSCQIDVNTKNHTFSLQNCSRQRGQTWH